jgi:hypothetical protein
MDSTSASQPSCQGQSVGGCRTNRRAERREPILDAFTIVRRKVDELGEGDRGWILNGLRGVAKTVLLNELAAR